LPALHVRQDALRARFPVWTATTLDGLLEQTAATFTDRPFVVTDQQSWTYQDMLEWSTQLAAGLVDSGVRPGHHVAL
jgi:fatty-acyl-CoA synthase